MGTIIDFFEFLWRLVTGSARYLVSVPGIVVAGVAAFATAISHIFGSHFGQSSDLFAELGAFCVAIFNNLATYVQGLPPVARTIVYFAALDQMTLAASSFFALTIGVVVSIVAGVFLIVIPFLVVVITLKSLIWLLRIIGRAYAG